MKYRVQNDGTFTPQLSWPGPGQVKHCCSSPWIWAPVCLRTVGIRKSWMKARLPWLATSSRSKATIITENSRAHLPWFRALPEWETCRLETLWRFRKDVRSGMFCLTSLSFLAPAWRKHRTRCRRGRPCWGRCPSGRPPPPACPGLCPTYCPAIFPLCWSPGGHHDHANKHTYSRITNIIIANTKWVNWRALKSCAPVR